MGFIPWGCHGYFIFWRGAAGFHLFSVLKMMGKFIKQSVLFGSIVICCMFLASILIIEINRNLYGKIKIEKKISTIIIGDSHTACAINDSLTPEILNLSVLSEGYFFSYLKLGKIIQDNSKVKNVILGFSYHNLSIRYERFVYGTPFFNSISRYISLMDLKDFFTLLSKQSSLANLAPIFRSSLGNIVKYYRKGNPCVMKDFIPNIPGGANGQSIVDRINYQYYFEGEPCKVSDFNIFYLKKIVELCREKRINLVLLNVPMFDDYNAKIPLCVKSKYDSIVNNSGVPLINLNDFHLPKECFFPEGDHLNSYGATLTTNYLINYLNNSQF
jgi:hypothetical protein